jgi:hypothetical protein
VLRDEVGLPTYRYEWAATSAISRQYPGLALTTILICICFLDTYLIATGEITDLEVQTSERMQDYFLDFVEDPESLPGMDGLNMMSLRPEEGNWRSLGRMDRWCSLLMGILLRRLSYS